MHSDGFLLSSGIISRMVGFRFRKVALILVVMIGLGIALATVAGAVGFGVWAMIS